MEIMGNLWQVGGAQYTSVEDAAIYLIRFGEKAALIDAGCGGAHDSLAANISDILPPDVEIEYLFLTHCHYDHTGGAAAVRDQFGCRIVAHELDASFLEDGDSTVTAANWYDARMEPLKIDIKIKNIEETFKVGAGRIVAHHCPGHSPGSVVYLAELGSNLVLFGQDVHGPLDAAFLSNRDDYKRSLKFLAGLDADVLCEGHFGIYQGKKEVNQFIRTYLDG
jgi:glyoxylase-like metal-dependent hydrolase (beta-lactamase superfamily II)